MSPRKRTPEATVRLRASIVEHARRIITRDGASALTVRALATEGGCALGLPYTVFADRDELVAEIVTTESTGLMLPATSSSAEPAPRPSPTISSGTLSSSSTRRPWRSPETS